MATLGKAMMTLVEVSGVALVVPAHEVLHALLSGPMGPPSTAFCTEPTLVVLARLHQPLVS